MSLKYECIEIKDKKVWDEFIEADNSQILQSYNWGEIKSNFGWLPIRLGLYCEKKLISIVSILKKTIPYTGGLSIFYAPRGPITDYHNDDVLKILIDEIKKIAKKHKAIVLKIDPFINDENELVKQKLINLGFIKANEQIQPRCTFILDLNKSQEKILENFEPKTRYNIKVGKKKGVLIEKSEESSAVKIFYDLLITTAKRDKFTIHTEDYYNKIWQYLSKGNKCVMFFAKVNEEIVSAVYIFIFGDTCWYMYGASCEKYRNYMPNQLLHYEIISWAQSKGIKKYDLWGIPCKLDENHPLWGVYRFKKGFGGEQLKLIGVYDLPLSWLYSIWTQALYTYRKLVSLKTRKSLDNSLEE